MSAALFIKHSPLSSVFLCFPFAVATVNVKMFSWRSWQYLLGTCCLLYSMYYTREWGMSCSVSITDGYIIIGKLTRFWRVSSSGMWRRVVCCVGGLFFRPWRWRRYVPPKRRVQQTTRRHIPEDDTLHNHRCENLKSYLTRFCLTYLQYWYSSRKSRHTYTGLLFHKFA
jgi:hypothetical protein